MPVLLVLAKSHNTTAAAVNLGWLTSKEQVVAIRKVAAGTVLHGTSR
jgi:diketogulonate reductase-like aldo/keto reductase